MPDLLIYLIVIVIGSVLIWKGSDILESSARKLSLYYGLPTVVHGAIVVAIGSSFPELSSTVLATLLHGDFELGLSAVIGSAIFNILVIPGLSGLAAKKQLKAEKNLVYRDAQFYIISIAVLLITFSFAVIYFPASDQQLQGSFTRILALVPLALYGLYLFIQYQEVIEERQKEKPPGIKPGKNWLWLLLSLALVVAGVEGLVRSAIFLGEFFNTPTFIWGISVIAAVTSMPDAFISIRMARNDEGISSLSNVLGSNIFDLLVAVPVGVLIAGSTLVDFAIAAPLMGVLTFATILLFTTLRTKLILSKIESWTLLVAYMIFIAWIIFESLDLINLLPQ
ncbi:MAG: sodium:calcium antiporter [Candidatus Cyclobacteriaceae bacterium M3_2C_046]